MDRCVDSEQSDWVDGSIDLRMDRWEEGREKGRIGG